MKLVQQQILSDVMGLLDPLTPKERLEVASFIVLQQLAEPQEGMTQADSYLDVLTRHISDITTQARGRLLRYGNNGYPSK